MKKTKHSAKILSLLMALLMLSSVIILPASAATAPKAPSTLTATQSTTAIKLTWSKVSGATGYRIYYKLPGDLSWRTGLSSTASTTHTFKGLPEGQSYTFAVRSYTKSNGKITWGSYKQIATATKTAAPKKLTAAQNTSAIKLTWSYVAGATGYRVYYKTTSKSDWKIATSATIDTTVTYSKLSSGKKYTFAVKPYIKTSSGVIWGKHKEIGTATKPATPKNLIAGADYNKKTISLSWKKVTGADGYKIYYKKSSDKAWTKAINSITATNYTFKNMSSAVYEFAVRPFVKTSSGTILGNYSTVNVRLMPTTTTRPTTTHPTTTKAPAQQSTTKATTTKAPAKQTTTKAPAQQSTEATGNKVDIYQTVFASRNFLIEVNDPDLGAVTIAMKGNKGYVEAYIEDMSLELIFNGDIKDDKHPDGTLYFTISSLKKYSTLPLKLYDESEKNEALSLILHSKPTITSTELVDLDGCILSCETAKDSKGNTFKYYFDGNILIRCDIIQKDSSVSTTRFSKITTEVPDRLFTIPQGYSFINLEWLLNNFESDDFEVSINTELYSLLNNTKILIPFVKALLSP